MSSEKSQVGRYLETRLGDSKSKLVTEIAVSTLSTLESTLNWKSMTVSDNEFNNARFIFERVPRPIGVLNEEELFALSKYFDDKSLVELKLAQVKSVNGQCKCGRNLNVYDILRKALDNSVHSVRFMKGIMNGEEGKFLICANDGTEEDRKKMPKNTIWVDNTKPTECVNCAEPHQCLLLMTHFMHNWVLMMPA